MELQELTASLARPGAFPTRPGSVEVRHTHISVVFIAGDLVYKVKKPVDFQFLNFLTLESRKKFCDAEVRLNSRLAPGVYLGVVPVTVTPEGPVFEGEGEPVEWAVKMRRLPDSATLAARLKSGDLDEAVLDTLGARIAAFHSGAERGPHVSVHGSFDTVAFVSRQNFEQSEGHAGVTLSRAVLERLKALNDAELSRLRPLIEARAARGKTRDVHGDLHLDHVYHFPGKAPPGDIAVLDCVEFNDAYRCSDVIADMAFLAMDLIFKGRTDLADRFVNAYFAASGDGEGRGLLPFYIAYRAAVRGKVEGFLATDASAPAEKREGAVRSARAHWLVALGALAGPREKPALILTSGLPGSGKSRVAADLEAHAGFTRIISDVVRKELAGLAPTQSAKSDFGGGIYTAEWNEKTYGECLKRTEAALFEGRRVVVDASFREEANREKFVALAREMGVPVAIIHRTAPEAVVRERLARRGDNSISDADWEIHRKFALVWEESSSEIAAITADIPHTADKREPLRLTLAALEKVGLY